jgi:hypothetical protein
MRERGGKTSKRVGCSSDGQTSKKKEDIFYKFDRPVAYSILTPLPLTRIEYRTYCRVSAQGSRFRILPADTFSIVRMRWRHVEPDYKMVVLTAKTLVPAFANHMNVFFDKALLIVMAESGTKALAIKMATASSPSSCCGN